MKQTDWHNLHETLMQCPWFTRVSQPTDRDGDPSVRRADSWAVAIQWSNADISWWCVNEASNVLREFLHTRHKQRYQEWNQHIGSFGPALDELVGGPVTASLPPDARTPGVMEWIRSQLTRAYLECVYAPLSDVQLVCDQVDWCVLGHFPCGWFVDAESGFPSRAVTVVY